MSTAFNVPPLYTGKKVLTDEDYIILTGDGYRYFYVAGGAVAEKDLDLPDPAENIGRPFFIVKTNESNFGYSINPPVGVEIDGVEASIILSDILDKTALISDGVKTESENLISSRKFWKCVLASYPLPIELFTWRILPARTWLPSGSPL